MNFQLLECPMLVKGKKLLIGLIFLSVPIIAFVISGTYSGGLPSNLDSISKGPESEAVMNNFRAVFVTTPSLEVAKKLAHGLVSNKLAACVNIIPQVTSVYEWEGKINEDTELLLMIKTEQEKFAEVEKFVKENHPYTVPEVIALPIVQGSEKYLEWIKDSISAKSSS